MNQIRYNWYLKQVEYGYASPAYKLLLKLNVKNIPLPPEFDENLEKKPLEGLIRKWRRNLNHIVYQEYQKNPNPMFLDKTNEIIVDKEYHRLRQILNRARSKAKDLKREGKDISNVLKQIEDVKRKIKDYEEDFNLYIPEYLESKCIRQIKHNCL
jgi:hypothetical protein